MKSRSKANFVGLLNERLIATLSGNLADMQHLARRDAVSAHPPHSVPTRTARGDVDLLSVAPQLEKLTLAVERLRGSGAATRATFLVLTRTLLLSLGDPDKAEHLLTCQRVYTLLEPHLLDVLRNDSELVGPAETHEIFDPALTQRCTQPAVVSVQQGEPQVSVPPSFADGLTAYLSQGDAGYSSVVLCLLRDFISSLRRCNASFKGKTRFQGRNSLPANTRSLTPGDSCR